MMDEYTEERCRPTDYFWELEWDKKNENNEGLDGIIIETGDRYRLRNTKFQVMDKVEESIRVHQEIFISRYWTELNFIRK